MSDIPCYPLNTLHVLGKRHTAILLEEIDAGRYAGFNRMVRTMSVTPKVLSERLTELGEAGMIAKNGEGYEITPKGKELVVLFRGIKAFHQKYGETSPECTEQRCTECSALQPEAKKMGLPIPSSSGNGASR